MLNEENLPILSYQIADLTFDMLDESIHGTTKLWLSFRNNVKKGSCIFLHCRQCDVKEVFINNVRCEFVHNDPLQLLSFHSKKQSYLGEEMDINYRAALEISRSGELEITIPNLTKGHTDLPRPIPKNAPQSVKSRYDKLIRLHRNLTRDVKDYGADTGVLDDPESSPAARSDVSDDGPPCRLLQVKIKYKLSKTKGKHTAGYVFRREPNYRSLFESTVNTINTNKRGEKRKLNEDMTSSDTMAKCVYTTNFSTGTLRNLDGVRCWLPCLDSTDQRFVFDVSFKTPNQMVVIGPGKRISSERLNSSSRSKQRFYSSRHHNTTEEMKEVGQKVTRFFSPNRISTMSLGFFIGLVESYKMSLYKVRGKIFVTQGLSDFISGKPKGEKGSNVADVGNSDSSDEMFDSPHGQHQRKEFIKRIPNTNNFNFVIPGDEKSQLYQAEDRDNTDDLQDKEDSDVMDVSSPRESAAPQTSRDRSYSMDPPTTLPSAVLRGTPASLSLAPPGGRVVKKPTAPTSSPYRLYADVVHHSTLGMDLALRILHKYLGRRYDYETFSFIYVHGLGSPFVSYDGFALIDADLLHHEGQIYLETTAHLQLIKAYLYSWFKSSIPIASYEMEFILHGAVGFLLNFYTEEVYGEDEGKYRFFKQYDTVVTLEKMGLGYSLANFFPENFEIFSAQYGQYLVCKSAVIFHLLENRVGGKDPLRMTLKQLIQSPPLHPPTQNANFHHLDFNPLQQPGSPSSTPPSPGSTYSGFTELSGGEMSPNMSPYRSGTTPYLSRPLPDSSPFPYAQSNSPNPYATAGSLSPYPYAQGGNLSPHPYAQGGDMSPHPYAQTGNYSPNPYGIGGNTSPNPYVQSGNLSPYPYAGNSHLSPYHGSAGGNTSPFISGQAGSFSPVNDYFSGAQSSQTSPREGVRGYVSQHPGAFQGYGGGTGKYEMNSQKTGLVRQSSLGSFTSWWDQDAQIPLTCDCVTAESFILCVRHSSGAAADIDESFLDKFVYGSGVLLVRVHCKISPKLENKPRQIYITTEQIGYSPRGEINKSFCVREDIKVRIAESRDDVVTEPTISISERDSIYQQQAFSRPGRRGGKRRGPMKRGDENEDNKSHEQIELELRREREREERKSAHQTVRDYDLPVRYIVVDPYCQHLIEVSNTSTDSLLIEQMYADFFENTIIMQSQALRCVARSVPASTMSTHTADSVIANASSASASAGNKNSKILEKSAKLELKFLADCVRGLPSLVSDPKCIEVSQLSSHIQVEAAFALATWQTENAPREHSTEGSTLVFSAGQLSHPWQGLFALRDCLLEMFMDEETFTPSPNDFTNESATVLRNGMLLALSSIVSQNGHSPLEAVELILFFAEHEILGNIPTNSVNQENEKNDEANDDDGLEDTPDPVNPIAYIEPSYDETHYRAVLFLALSRLRFDTLNTEQYFPKDPALNGTMHPIIRIVNMVKDYVDFSLTQARAIARINFQNNEINSFPSLPAKGVDIAAAITCLAEMDIQAMHLMNTMRGVNTSSLNLGFSYQTKMREIDLCSPTGIGFLSMIKYKDFFLPPGTNLQCVLPEDEFRALLSRDSSRSHHHHFPQTSAIKEELSFALCSPTVRAAALEAFIRCAFAHHVAHYEKIDQQLRMQSMSAQTQPSVSQGSKVSREEIIAKLKAARAAETTFAAAAVEVVTACLKNDPDTWVRQQAAQVLLDCVQDRPPRVAAQAISLGNPLYCLGWSDTSAVTFRRPGAVLGSTGKLGSKGHNNKDPNNKNKSCLKVVGQHMRIAVKLWWRVILTSSSLDQVTRCAMLQAWMFAFGRTIPRALLKETGSQSGDTMIVPAQDRFFDNLLPLERLNIKNPSSVYNQIEQVMKYGANFKGHARSKQSKLPEISELQEGNLAIGEASNDGLKLSLNLGKKSNTSDVPSRTQESQKADDDSQNKSFKLVFK